MQSKDALSYLLSLDLDQPLRKYFNTTEIETWNLIKDICSTIPKTGDILAVLLTRKWPKWHTLSVVCPDEALALDALITVGIVESLGGSVDWDSSSLETPRLVCESEGASILLRGLDILRSNSRVDVLFESLSIAVMKGLYKSNGASLSKPALIQHIMKSYNGKQRTIFGDVNDRSKMLRQISKLVCGEPPVFQLVLLKSPIRDLFLRLTFLLDIDADDDLAWNAGLPTSLLKGAIVCPDSNTFFEHIQEDMHIYENRNQLEMDRLIRFLEWLVEEKRDAVCVSTLSSNIRALLDILLQSCEKTIALPEYIWRRRTPRRLANLLWRCVAELERLKLYELAVVQMEFLLDHQAVLVGKKRLGKIAIRLLIALKHVGESHECWFEKILKFDLFPADLAELTRRTLGESVTKFEWPCGQVVQREVYIPGCLQREFNWVETAAIENFYVASEGLNFEHGIHCEGRVMMHVYEVMFAAVLGENRELHARVGIWQSPIQRWALDAGFIGRDPESQRWRRVEQELAEIESLDFDQIANKYMQLVRRPSPEEDQIISILKCFTGKVLAQILRHIATDPFYWSGGQPDLLLWDTRSRKILFSEVKGPGDQLMPRQRFWLAALQAAGAEAEVCWVKEAAPNGPKQPRKKKIKVLESSKHKVHVEPVVIDLIDSSEAEGYKFS